MKDREKKKCEREMKDRVKQTVRGRKKKAERVRHEGREKTDTYKERRFKIEQ